MTETYYLRPLIEAPHEHRFDLTGDHTGVTGVCTCGYVFAGVTDLNDLWALVTDHCDPIAEDG